MDRYRQEHNEETLWEELSEMLAMRDLEDANRQEIEQMNEADSEKM